MPRLNPEDTAARPDGGAGPHGVPPPRRALLGAALGAALSALGPLASGAVARASLARASLALGLGAPALGQAQGEGTAASTSTAPAGPASAGSTSASAAAGPAPRIVSVGGALTETLYALGAERLLVGVDTTSIHPAEARQLPSVGYARTLSAEGVLSLRPTVLIATEEAGPPPVLRQLESAGLPIVLLASDYSFEGVIARTARLAERIDHRAQGEALIARLRQDWQATQARVAARRATDGGHEPRVLFVLSHVAGQARVAGGGSGADAMIRLAGGRNALGEAFQGYRPLTPEAAIAAAPEVIVTTRQGLDAIGGAEGVLRLPGLDQTPAGRQKRVVVMDTLLLLGFTPRLPEAVDQLSAGLHVRG